MAGSDIASVEAVAATGADFVALSSAVFGDGVDPEGRPSHAPTRSSTKPRRASRADMPMPRIIPAVRLLVAMADARIRGVPRTRRRRAPSRTQSRCRTHVDPDRFGAPPTDAAYGAFQRGLYMTALNLALPRAEAGDPAAQTLAAEILSRGLGVRARRGGGRQMVPACRRAGRARSAVPVCAAADRRAFRQEGPRRAPMR